MIIHEIDADHPKCMLVVGAVAEVSQLEEGAVTPFL